MHRIPRFSVPRAHEVPLSVIISGHHTNLHGSTLVCLSRRIRHTALKGASFRFCCNLASCLTTTFLLFSLEDPPLIGGCLHCLPVIVRNHSECAAPLIQLYYSLNSKTGSFFFLEYFPLFRRALYVVLASHKMYMHGKDIVASHFLQAHFSVRTIIVRWYVVSYHIYMLSLSHNIISVTERSSTCLNFISCFVQHKCKCNFS